jgi:glyoxylase-like metal-dependent hydrolase (beta-lactamase superfamily II)
MKIGEIVVYPIIENYFLMDGGAMFGVIPKVIWSKFYPSDENNLVRLDLNPLLVKTGQDIVVIDSGLGDVLTERERKIYPVPGPSKWDEELKRLNLKPEDVTAVILTHAHADHITGTLKLDKDGRPGLRFPAAKIYIQKGEWHDAMNPDERTAAAYLVHNLRVIEESGKLELLDGDTGLFPGVSVKIMGGHTPFSQAVLIDGGGERIIYPADIMPSSAHIRIPYVAAVDLDPATTMERKRWLNEHMLKDDWTLAFDHDIVYKLAKFREGEKGRIEPVKVE